MCVAGGAGDGLAYCPGALINNKPCAKYRPLSSEMCVHGTLSGSLEVISKVDGGSRFMKSALVGD